MKTKNQTFDLIALSSSLVCAVHCAAVPIVLSFSSLGSLHFLENPWIEWSFVGAGLLFVGISLWPSYHRVHHKRSPLLLAGAGFALIGTGRLAPEGAWEAVPTVTGAMLVAAAHYFNWKLLRGKSAHTH